MAKKEKKENKYIKAAQEINELLGWVSPEGDEVPLEFYTTISEEEVKNEIKTMLAEVTDDDEFSPGTQAVIDELKEEIDNDDDETTTDVEESEEETDEETDEIEDVEDEDAEKDTEEDVEDTNDKGEYDELIEEIQGATKLSELKAIIIEHREFKGIRNAVENYKKSVDLKEAMITILNDLDGKPESMKPEVEPKRVFQSKAAARETPIIKAEKKVEIAERVMPKTVKNVQKRVVKTKRKQIKAFPEKKERNSIFSESLKILGKTPDMTLRQVESELMALGIEPRVNNGARTAHLMMKRCVEALREGGHKI